MTHDEILAIALKALKKGGGGGGTSNYNDLSNQPQVNGTTLIGNKTSADLGIADLSAVIADAFDETLDYAVNDIVTYEGGLYQFTTVHTANDPWDANEVEQITVGDSLRRIHSAIADDFDETATYAVDDLIVYGGNLYKFTTAHSAGAWDLSEVSTINLVSLLGAKPDAVIISQANYDLLSYAEKHDLTKIYYIYDGQGGGGGGTTSDYDDLIDKPQINGNVLQGNQSFDDLGVGDIGLDSGQLDDLLNLI